MRSASRVAWTEWAVGQLPEATRIATLLTADPVRGPRVAEEALARALPLTPFRKSGSADVLLAQLVRRSVRARGGPVPETDPLSALRNLKPRQRAALVLVHYADVVEERAAAILGRSPASTRALVTGAVRALPPDKRADVREWLESLAGSAGRDTGSAPRSVRAAARRRLVATTLTPIVLAVAGLAGVEASRSLRTILPEDESNARDELAAVRDPIEMRGAELPFGSGIDRPATERLWPLTTGRTKGQVWSVDGYRDPYGNLCLQLVVGYDFGSRRCLYDVRGPIRALVNPDPKHRATFLYGVVAPGIESLRWVGPGSGWGGIDVTRAAPGFLTNGKGSFGVGIPEYLLPLASRDAARRLGYEAAPARLVAMDGVGRTVAELKLFLGRR